MDFLISNRDGESVSHITLRHGGLDYLELNFRDGKLYPSLRLSEDSFLGIVGDMVRGGTFLKIISAYPEDLRGRAIQFLKMAHLDYAVVNRSLDLTPVHINLYTGGAVEDVHLLCNPDAYSISFQTWVLVNNVLEYLAQTPRISVRKLGIYFPTMWHELIERLMKV